MNPLFVPTNWNKYNIYVIAHKLHPLGWRFKESIATGETDKFNVPTYTFVFTSNIYEFSGYTLKFTQVYDKMHSGWDVSLVKNVTSDEASKDNISNSDNKEEENTNSSTETTDDTND